MLNIAELIINLSTYSTCAYFLYKIITIIIPIRKSRIAKIATFLILIHTCSAVIYPEELSGTLLTFLALLVTISVFFSGNWIQKLSVVIILYPIVISLNYLTQDLGFIIYWHKYNTEMSILGQTLLHTATMILRIPVWYAIWRAARKWLTETVEHMTTVMWLTIDILCLTSFISIISIVYFADSYTTYLSYPACIACILTSVGCCYLCAYISRSIRTEVTVENLRYQQSYYEELEQSQEKIRKLNHDINNHLSVVNVLMNNQQYTEASEYFARLSGEFSSHSRVFCQNSIVNAILNNKYNLALQHEIDCFFNIAIDQMIAVDDISLCSLFSNTLDNAIEANLKLPAKQRSLSLKARYQNGSFSYEIQNNTTGDIPVENGSYLTQKADKKAHGYGLKNIRDLVNRYDGVLDITAAEATFTVTVLISNI